MTTSGRHELRFVIGKLRGALSDVVRTRVGAVPMARMIAEAAPAERASDAAR
ncbi:hypothetical protein ABZV67_03030 [Streptomyces sp. NPDC005065]|uniref:hypothetical protein n=1 Tax=Streptomyces sp. NPDC005065 TaxID=3154461 RepID=UPI00339E9375